MEFVAVVMFLAKLVNPAAVVTASVEMVALSVLLTAGAVVAFNIAYGLPTALGYFCHKALIPPIFEKPGGNKKEREILIMTMNNDND